MSDGNSAFPKRRGSDTHSSAFGVRMISFTDLMAVLLSFFILLYATREPTPPPPRALGETQNIAPIVAQPPVKTSGTLARPLAGLDLNYIAALLRQAQARDPLLSDLKVVTYPYALVLTMQNPDQRKLELVIDKIATYRRTVEVFASPSDITALMAINPNGLVRYFPQEGNTRPRILIH